MFLFKFSLPCFLLLQVATSQIIDTRNLVDFREIISSDVVLGSVSGKCSRQLKEFKASVFKEEWATKMLDASSKLPSGLLEGNIFDFGNFGECIEIEHKMGDEDLLGKYCAFSMIINIPLPKSSSLKHFQQITSATNNTKNKEETQNLPLTLSLCVPDACDPTDFLTSAESLRSGNLIKFNNNLCQTRDFGKTYDGYDIFALALLGILALLTILCTTYDVYTHKKGQEPKHVLMVSFSLYSNGKKFLETNSSSGQFTCLNGIRVFSMMWVVIGHKIAGYVGLPAINYVEGLEWQRSTYSQYAQGGAIAVDTFLFLTGLLLVYNFVKTHEKPGPKFNVLVFYIHRYLRITPSVAALYLASISLFRHTGSGPLWPAVAKYSGQNCLKYWWSYFLYIQNYVNLNQICLIHTWYLNVDMQLFILSPIVLIPLAKYRKPTIYGLLVLTMISIISVTPIAYIYETQLLTQPYYDYFYYLTHTRLAPYLIGMIMGVVMNRYNKRTVYIHWAFNLLMWLIVLTVMGAIIFTGNDITYNYDRLNTTIYLTLNRPLWAVCLSWIVFSCVKGYGGFINWILSIPAMQVLGKLTYSMYLVHYMVLLEGTGRLRLPIFFSDYDLVHSYWGDLVTTMILAFFWTLIFESPVIIIENVIFGADKKKKKEEEKKKSEERDYKKEEILATVLNKLNEIEAKGSSGL